MKKAVLLYITLSIIASALNYLTYPLMSHLLPAGEYIDITLAVSIFTQIGTFMSALIAITIALTKQQTPEQTKLVSDVQVRLLRIFALIGLGFIVLSPFIMPAIGSRVAYAFPIAFMLVLSIPITVISGYFNGKQALVKLGSVALTVAIFQLLLSSLTAYLTKSGVIAMAAMVLAQLFSICVIFFVYRHESLPNIVGVLRKNVVAGATLRPLLRYTLLSSVAIMIVNLLQVADLIIVKMISPSSALLYTDIYVISRIVFFAGMILIWPFLGNIKQEKAYNQKLFIKLVSIFFLLSVGAVAVVAMFGNLLFTHMFGRTIDVASSMPFVILSVVYKFLYLAVTALCLAAIVLWQKWHLKVALALAAVTILTPLIMPKGTSPLTALFLLDCLVAMITIVATWLFLTSRPHPMPIRRDLSSSSRSEE